MVDAGARYVLLETGLFVVLGGGLATVGVLTIGATVVGVDIFGVVEASTDTVTVSVTTTGEPLSVEQPATRSKKTELATRTRTLMPGSSILALFFDTEGKRLVPPVTDRAPPMHDLRRWSCLPYRRRTILSNQEGSSGKDPVLACFLHPRREFRQQQIV